MAFKEPVHKIVDRIKNEPYFRWPNKMGGDLSRRKGVYHRVVSGVKRSSRAAGESKVFEGVWGRFQEPGYRARSLAKRKSSPTATGSD